MLIQTTVLSFLYISLKLPKRVGGIYFHTHMAIHRYILDHKTHSDGVGFMGNTILFRDKWLI